MFPWPSWDNHDDGSPCQTVNIETDPSSFREERGMATRLEPPQPPSSRARPAPDGPRGHWLIGCMRAMQADPLGFNWRTWCQYGDIARIRAFPGVGVYLLAHPDAVEHVLVRNHKNYRKPDFFNGPVGELAGKGLVTSEGDAWRAHRKLIQPAFHRERLAGLAGRMAEAAEATARDWERQQPGRTLDILPEMMRLTLRVV